MPNITDKQFFYAVCKTSNVNPQDVIKLVWGRFDKYTYWYGEGSETIHGNNIWQARTNAIHRAIDEGRFR